MQSGYPRNRKKSSSDNKSCENRCQSTSIEEAGNSCCLYTSDVLTCIRVRRRNCKAKGYITIVLNLRRWSRWPFGPRLMRPRISSSKDRLSSTWLRRISYWSRERKRFKGNELSRKWRRWVNAPSSLCLLPSTISRTPRSSVGRKWRKGYWGRFINPWINDPYLYFCWVIAIISLLDSTTNNCTF